MKNLKLNTRCNAKDKSLSKDSRDILPAACPIQGHSADSTAPESESSIPSQKDETKSEIPEVGSFDEFCTQQPLLNMLHSAQQQYLPFGGYVNVRQGIADSSLMRQECQYISKGKISDILVPSP
mmetsp:Transcript_11064/g.16815  ORF Transcript_11064/g.16815 Transcript_11064/m.16815 type:complete len:124 (+) Transcript_11064:860-1231(+)